VTTTQPTEPGTRVIHDRLDIIDLTSRLCVLVDACDWTRAEHLFTDPVEVDYTSLNGGAPQTLRPGELIAGWRAALDHLDATQHLVGCQVVDVLGDDATCAANVQGPAILSGSTTTFPLS
jgi:SnoaL-like protein